MTDLIALAKECGASVADASQRTDQRRTRVSFLITALNDQLAAYTARIRGEARRDALEEAAKAAERAFGGKAHTYFSENADRYRAQDEASAHIAAAIRALGDVAQEPK